MKYIILIFSLILFSCNKDKTNIATNNGENSDYENAWRNLDNQKVDSAFYYFNQSKNAYIKSNDSLGIAKCLMNMSIIQRDYGDFFGSQENAIDALKIFDKVEDTVYVSTVLNVLGTNEMELGNYEQSLNYLNKAFSRSTSIEDRNLILNNKAITFSKLNFNDSCFIILKNLIAINKTNNSKYIDNYEYLRWKKNSNYNAEPKLLEALSQREKAKDFWGQNASHAHISDYYKEKSREKSLFHAQKMYDIVQKIKSPDDQLEALQKLIILENHENSANHFKTFIKLNDSLETVRSKAKNQFALIQYESEKNRGDFLKAKGENTEKNYQLVLLGIALLITVAVIFVSYNLNKKRRKRLIQEKHQEKQLEVKETALKYSKKVHDVVSNGIYQVMSKIENTESVDKTEVLDDLEIVYEKSRDISYEDLTGNNSQDFKLQISNLVNSFSSDRVKPILVGNGQELWSYIETPMQLDILLIVQELLVNMKKHSTAQKVLIKFEIIHNDLIISYSDDGIGIKNNAHKKNGLRNTENRIFSHNGTLTFEPFTGNGLKLKISFPLKNS